MARLVKIIQHTGRYLLLLGIFLIMPQENKAISNNSPYVSVGIGDSFGTVQAMDDTMGIHVKQKYHAPNIYLGVGLDNRIRDVNAHMLIGIDTNITVGNITGETSVFNATVVFHYQYEIGPAWRLGVLGSGGYGMSATFASNDTGQDIGLYQKGGIVSTGLSVGYAKNHHMIEIQYRYWFPLSSATGVKTIDPSQRGNFKGINKFPSNPIEGHDYTNNTLILRYYYLF